MLIKITRNGQNLIEFKNIQLILLEILTNRQRKQSFRPISRRSDFIIKTNICI